MLFLEDYLEMIEHLPTELRDRFTEMREMDLSVQNRVDSLDQRQKTFFSNCKKMKQSDRDEEFEKIRKEYKKVIEDSSEKIQNAEESYNLVDRYLRKLDQDLHYFKLELEADNRGITEILEKRSLEMDNPVVSSTKENRHPKKQVRKSIAAPHLNSSSSSPSPVGLGVSMDTLSTPSRVLSKGAERKNPFLFTPEPLGGGLDTSLGSASPGVLPGTSGTSSSSTYPLQHMGAGGNAIAVAASQAIAATQQLVPGRRTSSLKASYEAINLGMQTHDFTIGRELAGAAQTALAATNVSAVEQGGSSTKKQKVSKRAAGGSSSSQSAMLDVVSGGGPLADENSVLGLSGSPSTEEILQGNAQGEEWYDPSEPRYCICNQVSYGDMVACDNEDCPYEWFHYPCVGISAPPKGKWYCPTCLARRKGRK